jgi:hypothetical protein
MQIVWICSLLPLYRTPRPINRTMNSTNMHKMTSLLLVVNKKIEQKMLARRWRRIPCKNFGEHLGCAMLKVGSRRTWSPVERGASKRREAWHRINLAEARSFFPSVVAGAARHNAVERSSLAREGAGEADLRRDGEVEPRRRRNWEAPAESRGAGAGGEREGTGAGEISSHWGLQAFAK